MLLDRRLIFELFLIKANYRNLQFESESFKLPLNVVKSGVYHRFANLTGRITKFALESIYSEVVKSMSIENDDILTEDCTCEAKRVYVLPCKHQLAKAADLIPLEIVPSRWHILSYDGRGA